MARKAREKSITGMYNIILKSSEVLFKAEEDYDFFVAILKEYISDLYAFAATPKYICLAAKESESGIGMDMKPLITRYARYYNKKYQMEGKLFNERFKSEPIVNDEELKNSVALISNVAKICGEGYTSLQPAKEYDIIPFYSKIFGVEPVAKVKEKVTTQKTVSVEKNKKEKPKSEKTEQTNTKKQQTNNLPTWLL